ncbi:hypothetical protein [Mycobacterium sp. OTB74]|uniref:hypothetical protein n=1 Tax=Mycobacterium sp. OTB74 TaxID=1853452 RepID=UPI0024754A81|nr:hypothetical protein [Mycobacterium sp. OTB74]MDH6245484.1 hypothetical protein [Mycobacterium sp. OTB74]
MNRSTSSRRRDWAICFLRRSDDRIAEAAQRGTAVASDPYSPHRSRGSETMIGMSQAVFVALIGLLGSSVASVMIAEWLKRRDNRASAASDLDIWAKLPEGEAKSRLLTSVERRVSLMIEPPKPSVSSFALVGGVLYVVVLEVISAISGDARWERHSDGMLWRRTSFDSTVRYEAFDSWLAFNVVQTIFFGCFWVLCLWVVRRFGLFGNNKAAKEQTAEE